MATTPVTPVPTATTPDDDQALTSQLVASLIGTLQAATSPDLLEAQSIILRRIALEGDVVNARIPAPLNISEIGGYINLLGTLKQPVILQQALAGALGVAGPNPPLGWVSNTMPLAFVTLTNDRPAGPAQASIPLAIAVRSDFVSFLQAQLQILRNQGCVLPMQAQPIYLPPSAPGTLAPSDPLPYLGRTLDLFAGAALADPASDALVIVQSSSGTGIQVMASTTNTAAVPAASFTAYQLSSGAMTTVPVTESLVAIAPLLANAGFYPSSTAVPTVAAPAAWAHFTNITGLVAGVTKLGDELSLLYNWSAIMSSVFASELTWVWNGTQFASS
jgi:hypothetical protein